MGKNIKIVMGRVSFSKDIRHCLVCLSFCLISLSFNSLQAQVKPNTVAEQVIGDEPNLQLSEDARLTLIINKRVAFNKKLASTPQGYRIVLYSGRIRQLAYNAQERFKREYPEQEAYLTYVFPNFKITAGDYKTKEQAALVLNEIKALFPDQILLIIPQKIDLTKAYEPEQQ